MRTVLMNCGEESRSRPVRTTYSGVCSVCGPSFSMRCSIVPNQVRTSGLSESALLKNSFIPVWMRNDDCAAAASSTVHIGPAKVACEKGCVWIGRYHDGQIGR